VLWYAKAVVDNVGNYGRQLRNNYWRYPALHPTTPWIDNTAPDKVKKLKVIDVDGHRVLCWTAPKAKKWNDEAVKYVVYCFDKSESLDIDDPSKIVAITEDTHFELPEQPRKTRQVYVVTALDRMHNESSYKKVKVKY
jgi:nitrous oxide reductase accessory protein NosL